MMDFPSSPSVGQIFNSGTGTIYIWDGVAWSISTSQTKTARRTNLVINGALNVSQENGNTEGTTSNLGYYAADQITGIINASPAAYGFSRIISANVSGSQFRLQFRVTTAKASLAAADVASIQTKIEGLNMQDLAWNQPAFGTPAPKDAVLAFNFNGPAGTYGISIRNAALTYTFVTSFTITAGQAGIDTAQVIKIPAPPFSMGPWATDNTIGMYITFALAAGSTLLAPAAGWQAGNFTGVTGMSNGLAAVQSFQLWDVYFGADPDKTGVPPVFEVTDYATELTKCMRYFEIIGYNGCGWSGWVGGVGQGIFSAMQYKVKKRAVPSLSSVNFTNTNFPATSASLTPDIDGFREGRSGVAVGAGNWLSTITANARM